MINLCGLTTSNCHSHLVFLLVTLWPFLCLVTFLLLTTRFKKKKKFQGGGQTDVLRNRGGRRLEQKYTLLQAPLQHILLDMIGGGDKMPQSFQNKLNHGIRV